MNAALALRARKLRLASMGPRSHERGNICSTALKRAGGMLQWGRVLMNAETGFTEAAGNMALQWGRVLMNAETRRASMVNGAAFS